MNENELQQLVEVLSLSYFQKPFTHMAKFNKRLRTTGGRYMLQDHSIEVNPLIYEQHGKQELTGVIKHELCHYHLHLEGKGYKHGDREFKELLERTNSPRYCKEIRPTSNRRSSRSYIFECQKCLMHYVRKKRMNVQKYRCGKCGGLIKEVQVSE